MHGGWSGSAPLADLWRLDGAAFAGNASWSPDVLHQVSPSRPQPTGLFTLTRTTHRAFPLLHPGRRWRRLDARPAVAAHGMPKPRSGHTAAVIGYPGGEGARRHAMIVVGGRGTASVLDDAWELSLESTPPAQASVQAVQCNHTGGATLAITHSATTARATLPANATASEVVAAVEAVMGGRVRAVTVGAAEPTAGIAPHFASYAFGSLCDHGSAAPAAVHVRLEPAEEGGDGGALPMLSLETESDPDGGGVASTAVIKAGRAPVEGPYLWRRLTAVGASLDGSTPPQREQASAVAVGDPEGAVTDARTAVLVYGGKDHIGPRRDAWLFTAGDSPGSGSWRRVAAQAKGGAWTKCTQTFFQWLVRPSPSLRGVTL